MAWDDSGEHPPGGESGETAEVLRRLEQRLEQASDAAERLLSEAAQAAASRLAEGPRDGAGAPPPAGWQTPREPAGDAPARPGEDLDLLVQLVRSVRELIPPELQRRVGEALRELLLALRALIDWYLQRIEQRRATPAEAQDIPIL